MADHSVTPPPRTDEGTTADERQCREEQKCMSNNASNRRASFGAPEQRGNTTIYPAAPVSAVRTANGEKLRVAAYVRVSTDSIEQEGSLELQREYYENHIKGNPDYEFVGIYEDDGISATSVAKRKGFLKLMDDSLAGKIDLILTKSVSRFARNLAELLYYVNKLNALNSPVEIQFETDRLSTFGYAGELLIIILGILAEMESRTKSEAITWAIDHRFAQGQYYAPAVLGFDKEKGRGMPLTINVEEAKTVRLCYALTILGYSFPYTANTLNTLGLSSKPGNVNWKPSGVINLLSNEKYAGHIKARKTITRSYKDQRPKKNEGEKPQYYEKEHHDAIVPLQVFEVVQRIIRNRVGNNAGIPHLTAVPEGALKGFIAVSKYLRGYTLDDYAEASRSVYAEKEKQEIRIPAKKAGIFDLRTFDTVSTLTFDDRTKPSCSIKGSRIIFNAACEKALGAGKAEILFHPDKAILALRSSTDETVFDERVKGINIKANKAVHLSKFLPLALESAALNPGYRYRIYGTRRAKNGESIVLFDLRNAQIMPSEKDTYILLDKYADSYGNGYYENIAACGLHRIDIEGLWQALHESRPTDSLAGQIVELTEFCRQSLAEFELIGE